MKATFPLPPGATLGLMGGGQLGRMFAQSAATLGYRVLVLEKNDCPAAEVAADQIQAAYTDPNALRTMKERVAAVTTEFENVPAQALAELAAGEAGCVTAPASHAVSIAQDRLAEKSFLEHTAGVPVAPHAAVLAEKDVDSLSPDLFPGILKTTRLGYDGKGQRTVRNPDEARRAFLAMGGVPCILEKRLALVNEVSVIVARSLAGDAVTFPVFENHHKNGILAETVVPARVDDELAQKARGYAATIAHALQYTGVLCVEFFIVEGGRIVANEMAPRPHNSGHATIEACLTSQYEEQVRAMAGLPLGPTDLVQPAVMLNILGDVWYETRDDREVKREPDWAGVLAVPGAKLHLYGKTEARHARKMGHVTCVGKTLEAALDCAKAVAAVLHMDEPV